MARPRKSTRDEWLDTFADWDAEAQESALDLCELIHRQAKRRASKKTEEVATKTAKVEAPADPQLPLNGVTP